jgi:hypothetical protein
MPRSFEEFIAQLKTSSELSLYSEAETKQFVVLPLLRHLNWDDGDRGQVRPEYAVQSRRVDYALMVRATPKVFLEVKRSDQELGIYQEQLLDYAFKEGVRLAALTNGITWWLYLPLHEGTWDQRRFYTIDILEQGAKAICDNFSMFLSKENVESQAAVKNAEAIFDSQRRSAAIRQAIPKAWRKLHSEADPVLVDLLRDEAESISGFKADDEDIKEFLQQCIQAADIPPAARPKPSPPSFRPSVQAPPAPPSYSPDIRRPRTSLRVSIQWPNATGRGAETIEGGGATDIFLRVLSRIAEVYGADTFARLQTLNVNRGPLLSKSRTRYHRRVLMGFYVNVNNSTAEKEAILRQVVEHLHLPVGTLNAHIVG